MSATDKFYWLMSGVVSLLVVASLVGWVLSKRVKTDESKAVVANLQARVKAWWMMIAFLATAFWLGKITTLVLFGFASFSALREFITLTPTKPSDHQALFVAFFIIVPVQYLLIGIDWYGLFSIFIPVYAFLLLPILSARKEVVEHFLERVAKIQWGVMIAVFCISHAPALLILQIPGYENQNFLLLFFLIFVVQMSDVLQYVFGKLFGKTKIAPVVSPSKTWEGLMGGGLSATLLGTCMWWITPFTPWQAALISAAIVLMGFWGGLSLSAVKRSLGAKDWGVMIEGHGGVMDRMDSVSFAAPIFFHITRYFFT
ncbi:MAG TPA: phosphatidate cytidylyltransferase [Pseudomonadales bacterium]|nr:phosphatidate cytidylyltransferase [Pseudomonadales bacterium]